MAEAITLSTLDSDLRAYTLDHKGYLVNKMWQIGLNGVPGTQVKPLGEFVQLLDADGTKILSEITTADPLQPGNKGAFNSKAYATFLNRRATPEYVKVDQEYGEVRINEMYNTYLARVKGGVYDPTKVPFEEFLLMNLSMDVQKYLRKAFWMASKNLSGTTSLDLFDGILTILADDLEETTPKVNIADITTITNTNAVANFELIAKDISDEQALGGNNVMIVSRKHMNMYNEDYRTRYGALRYNNEFKKTMLEGTEIEIIVDQWVATFDTPMITTRENMVMLLDDQRIGNVEFDYNKRLRNLAFLMDFRAGCGIRKLEDFTLGVVPE